jgi:4-alpha-glucanotransferase
VRWERQHSSGESAEEPFVSPADYPALSLATTGTHDTETLVEWWAMLGEAERKRLMEAVNRPAPADCTSAILDEAQLDAILESVYSSPAQLVVTPIQDLFGWDARINVPGTIADANWCWRLPFDLETSLEDPHVRRRAAAIRTICDKTGRFSLSQAGSLA